ncbi:MAG: hypothetical protein ACOZQL_24140 [Myxococcota bacterium]
MCADALLSLGEPQGQLIATHLAGLRDEPLEQELTGSLERMLSVEPTTRSLPRLAVDWRFGCVEALRWTGAAWDGFEPLERFVRALVELTTTPAELVASLDWDARLAPERLRVHRLLARLRTLHVAPWNVRPDHQPLWRLLREVGLPPRVRELVIDDVPHPRRDTHQLTWVELGDLSDTWPALAQLEALWLRGSYLSTGRIVLPNARAFTLVSSTFTDVDALRAADWPMLETLSVCFGDDSYAERAVSLDEVRALLRELPPTLKHLGLRNLPFTDELLPFLARWPGLARLESLDLSLGVLLDGARALRELAPAFRHLVRLDVTDTGLPDLEALQREVPGLWRGRQWRDKAARYVSLTE